MEIEILVRNYISELDKFFFSKETKVIQFIITEIRQRLFICSKRVTNDAILGIDGGNA